MDRPTATDALAQHVQLLMDLKYNATRFNMDRAGFRYLLTKARKLGMDWQALWGQFAKDLPLAMQAQLPRLEEVAPEE
jgi:hypothetical protein